MECSECRAATGGSTLWAILCATLVLSSCSENPPPQGADAGQDAGGSADAGWVNPDGGIPTGNCEQDHGIIANETWRLIQPHQGPCTVNEDCMLIDRSVPCSSFCREPVLAEGGADVRAEIVAYGEEVCPLVTCQSAGLCPAFDTAICYQGTCRRGFADGGLSP